MVNNLIVYLKTLHDPNCAAARDNPNSCLLDDVRGLYQAKDIIFDLNRNLFHIRSLPELQEWVVQNMPDSYGSLSVPPFVLMH